MKIGILTFHCAHNYGAVLQAYALKTKLIESGHNVEVINYRPQYLLERYKIFSRRILSKNPKILAKNIVNFIATLKNRTHRKKKFEEFIEKTLNVPSNQDVKLDYDLYIIGSDQVWNVNITKGLDKMYWGNFNSLKPCKKISYAASMGQTQISHSKLNEIKTALLNFDSISIREFNMLKTLQPLTNKQIKTVLDPTLLLDASAWDNLAKEPKNTAKYVLLYQVRHSIETINISKKIARHFNCQVIELLAYGSSKKNVANSFQACPKEFIGWIKNAECVVTTSFHGTAFSIIYKKDFFTVKLNDGGDSRSEFLLSSLHLSKRMITAPEDISYETINYEVPYRHLSEAKKSSSFYLSSHLNQ